jgi:hypothetical protein
MAMGNNVDRRIVAAMAADMFAVVEDMVYTVELAAAVPVLKAES